MVTPALEEPTTRVTLNLFARDVKYLKRHSDQYQAKIRDIIHEYCYTQRLREGDVVVMTFDD